MFLISSCSCLCPIHWSQVLSILWRCSWSSADRRCSNYIWIINNYIAYNGASYIRCLTVFPIFTTIFYRKFHDSNGSSINHFDGLVQDCSTCISSALTMEIMQFWNKALISRLNGHNSWISFLVLGTNRDFNWKCGSFQFRFVLCNQL